VTRKLRDSKRRNTTYVRAVMSEDPKLEPVIVNIPSREGELSERNLARLKKDSWVKEFLFHCVCLVAVETSYRPR